jgi:hypothetical protein
LRFTAFRPLLALVALVAVHGPAAAVCPGLDVLYQDSFEQLRPTWGDPSAQVKVENGQLVLSPATGSYVWAINSAGVYDDLDMCVTATTVSGGEPTQSKAGAIFWYEDVNNFYVFQIAPNGKASVWRRQHGKWLAQVNWHDAPSANKGDGVSNELRITATGSDARFFVNGTEFQTLTGSPPEDGGAIGVFAASPDNGTAVFAFDDLRATRP